MFISDHDDTDVDTSHGNDAVVADVNPSESNLVNEQTISKACNSSGSEMIDKPCSSQTLPVPSVSCPSTALKHVDQQKLFTDEECLTLAQTLFEGCTSKVHNRYLCQLAFCIDISDAEKKRLLPKKFNHSKLIDYWWLSFVEGQGMYC